MKKLLNTIYVTTDNSYLHKENETIVIKKDGEKIAQLPAHAIENILCFGYISASPAFMYFCSEKNISLSYYSENGKFLAKVQGRQTGNILLRKTQYRFSDNLEHSAQLAKLFIVAKLVNSRTVLQRHLRNHGENEKITSVIDHLFKLIGACERQSDLDVLRGYEGEAASAYFSVFQDLILNPEFTFKGRIKRPATDAVNALLSFTYTLITNEFTHALEGVGIDPYAGFLHRDRPGRASLSLDMIEDVRAWWADRFVLTLINRKQIKITDFETEASGAVRLSNDARKTFFIAFQEKKKEELVHPYLEEKISIGLLPHAQALLLGRYLRGDMAEYTPFLFK